MTAPLTASPIQLAHRLETTAPHPSGSNLTMPRALVTCSILLLVAAGIASRATDTRGEATRAATAAAPTWNLSPKDIESCENPVGKRSQSYKSAAVPPLYAMGESGAAGWRVGAARRLWTRHPGATRPPTDREDRDAPYERSAVKYLWEVDRASLEVTSWRPRLGEHVRDGPLRFGPAIPLYWRPTTWTRSPDLASAGGPAHERSTQPWPPAWRAPGSG
jgi:hypothetical protein